jgi:catechol 2,3-dioxygenase-like lactoylglutathione lyase family enzyme
MSASKLPERPSLAYLRKLAKDRLEKLRQSDPETKLAAALLDVAREYGFPSWRALKADLEQRQTQTHKPALNSPAMRFLAVRNVTASIEFYRDILGFEIADVAGATEAILGPARIRFETGAPRQSIVFLQTADVESAHAAIRARGGAPTAIEKVNWIKMQMFEIRDPDGNVLWFGQTFHQGQESPSRRGSQPHGLRQALPELPFDKVPAAIAWYRDILGFRINYQQHDLGVMDRDAITILLIVRTADHKGIGSCEFYVADADALYAEFTAKGAHTLGPPVSYPWGLRAFRVLDPEGNRLTFAQTFE